ncbi:MAG: hypothetical protein PHZ25_00670 [Candidatus Pacebacteria bacterium]|nr:hypothetical protein [Candidatus Paceibacterota bacterium]
MDKKEKKNKREGQALIEAIASIGIVVVGIFGTLAFLSTSIGLNRIVTGEYAGTYLAAAYIEGYKNCLDTEGWGKRVDCLDLTLSKIGEKVSLNKTDFAISYDDSSCESSTISESRVDVCATVKWQEKGDNFFVNTEDHFYNWR